jgi:hypothetical protein
VKLGLVSLVVVCLLGLGNGATTAGMDGGQTPTPSAVTRPAADPVGAVDGYLDALVAHEWPDCRR